MELAWLAMADGNIEDALAGLDSAARTILDPEDPRAEAQTAVIHTDVLLKLGDLESVVDVGLEAIDRATERGVSDAWSIQVVRCNVTEALTERGDIDRAATMVDPVADGTPSRDSWAIYAACADLDMRRGRLTDAAAFWEKHEELISSKDDVHSDDVQGHEFASWHIELALWMGEPTAALPKAFSALKAMRGTDASPFAGELFVLTLRGCADAAEHARATGDAAALQAALAGGARLSELRAAAEVDPFAAGPVPVTATADFLSWQAEESRLRGESDTTAWEGVAAAWDALGRPHRAAYARWRHAQALLSSRHSRTAATAVLRTAATQAVQHVPLSNAIGDLAHRARIELTQPATPSQPDEPIPALAFGLTQRELAVLQLLGKGKTNAEIGAELFISAKTASVHVTNILGKLKVSSRVQAAAVAAHARLLTSTETTDR